MGGQAMRTVGWIKPGGTVEFELSYALPASAFPQGSYSAVMAPQPLLQDPTLHLTVRGSDGRDVPVSVDSQPPAVGLPGPSTTCCTSRQQRRERRPRGTPARSDQRWPRPTRSVLVGGYAEPSLEGVGL